MHKNKSVFVVFEELCDWMAKRKFPKLFKSPHTEFVIENNTQPETAIDVPDSENTEMESISRQTQEYREQYQAHHKRKRGTKASF